MAWSTPSEAHASLHALMEQAETAVVERRHAAAADLYGLAAERSTSVFAPDSLLTATMQLRRANSLTARSVQPEVKLAVKGSRAHLLFRLSCRFLG